MFWVISIYGACADTITHMVNPTIAGPRFSETYQYYFSQLCYVGFIRSKKIYTSARILGLLACVT